MLSGYLDNIKISRKLVALFSAVLIGFFVLGITYGLELVSSKRAGERSSAFVKYEELVNKAHTNYLKVRRYETDFSLSISASTGQTYNDAPLENHAKHITALEDAMVELSMLAPLVDEYTAKVVADDENADTEDYVRNLVSQASDVASNYKDSFADIVKFQRVVGFTEEEGLRSQVGNRANLLEKGIDQMNNSSLFSSLTKLREYEKHIIQSIDLTEAHEELKNESKKFKRQLRASGLPVDEKITLTTYIDEYVDNMNQIVANKRRANEYTELYDFMLGPIFDEMGQSAQKRIHSNQSVLAKESSTLATIFIIAILSVAAMVSIILFMFGRSLTKPIQSLQHIIHEVNEGQLAARSGMQRNDELGELSQAFDKLLDERVAQLSDTERENDRLNESIVELLKSVAQLSKKDFTVKVPVFEDVTGAVGDSLNLLAGETGSALKDVRGISLKVAKVSSQVKDQSSMVMEEAQKERQQAETAMDELRIASGAMQKISRDAQQANNQAGRALENTQVALSTVNESVQGINSIRDTISETEKRIKRLGERSQEITGVVNLINSIAERTHILALNASMHAASAGEAGRGFAVVADEVQRLAENAREATKEISTLVNNIKLETGDTVTAMNNAITQVAKGTELAEQAGNAMLMTQASTQELVEAVELIATSSNSQAKKSVSLVERAKQIVNSTQNTDKHLKQQSVHTELLGRYSKNLVETVSVFKLPKDDENRSVVETSPVDELEQELNMAAGSN